jgi:hypothetical protein
MCATKITYEYEIDHTKYSDIKLALGENLISWGQIEVLLCDCLGHLIDSPSGGYIIWDKIRSLDTRLDVLDGLIKSETNEEICSRWTPIKRSVSKAKSKRNKIAHSSVASIDGKHVLVPYLSASPIDHDIVLTVENINQITKDFNALKKRVGMFGGILVQRKFAKKGPLN